MYFLRLAPLKEELITGLAEKERFKYLMAWELASVIVAVMLALSPTPMGLLEGAIAIITVGFGVWYAYSRNGRSAGTGLLERYLSLGWVLSIRILLARTLVSFPLYYASDILGFGYYDGDPNAWLETALTLIFGIYFIWAIGKHIGEVHLAVDTAPVAAPGPVPRPPLAQPPPIQPSQSLERFVETVVQREMAAQPRDIPAGSAVLHRNRRRAKAAPRAPARRKPARRAKPPR